MGSSKATLHGEGELSVPATVHSPVFTQLRELFATLQDVIDPSRRSDPQYVSNPSRTSFAREYSTEVSGPPTQIFTKTSTRGT
jgi:hypothetical protein